MTSGKNFERVTIEYVSRITIEHISVVMSETVRQNNDKHISQGSHEHFLIQYIKYDESSTITLKYFLRYSVSVIDLNTTNCVYDFVVHVRLL